MLVCTDHHKTSNNHVPKLSALLDAPMVEKNMIKCPPGCPSSAFMPHTIQSVPIFLHYIAEKKFFLPECIGRLFVPTQ